MVFGALYAHGRFHRPMRTSYAEGWGFVMEGAPRIVWGTLDQDPYGYQMCNVPGGKEMLAIVARLVEELDVIGMSVYAAGGELWEKRCKHEPVAAYGHF
jgi:hypothetical protein